MPPPRNRGCEPAQYGVYEAQILAVIFEALNFEGPPRLVEQLEGTRFSTPSSLAMPIKAIVVRIASYALVCRHLLRCALSATPHRVGGPLSAENALPYVVYIVPSVG